MMKKPIYALLSIFLIPSVLAVPLIDLSKSYTVPKVIEPNTKATLFIVISNPHNYPLSDFEIEFSSEASCIKIVSDKEWDLGTINPYDMKTIPLKVLIGNCKYDTYWIKADIEYYSQSGHEEREEYYPIVVTESPKLVIDNVKTVPEHPKPNEVIKLSFSLKNEGKSTLKNINVLLMGSECAVILSPNTRIIQSLPPNSTKTLTFNVRTTYAPCQIPIKVIYQDWAGNVYNETRTIGFNVHLSSSSITLKNLIVDNVTAGKSSKITLKVSNNGPTTLRNVLIKIMSDVRIPISFEQDEFFFSDFPGYYSTTISTKVYVDPSANGVYKVPVVVFYTDDSGKTFNTTSYITFKVIRKPELIVYLGDVDANSVTIDIANVGSVKARNVYVVLYKGNGYSINGNNVEFIGDLDEGDYDSADFDVSILSRNVTIQGAVIYQDALGNEYRKSFNLKATIPPTRVYSSESYYGLAIPLVIVALVVLVLVWRKKKRHAD